MTGLSPEIYIYILVLILPIKIMLWCFRFTCQTWLHLFEYYSKKDNLTNQEIIFCVHKIFQIIYVVMSIICFIIIMFDILIALEIATEEKYTRKQKVQRPYIANLPVAPLKKVCSGSQMKIKRP